jgi:hypothetical protein
MYILDIWMNENGWNFNSTRMLVVVIPGYKSGCPSLHFLDLLDVSWVPWVPCWAGIFQGWSCESLICCCSGWRFATSRIVLLYKIQHGLVAIPAETYLVAGDTRTRGENKFCPPNVRKDVYKYSFFPWTIGDWNRLPPQVAWAKKWKYTIKVSNKKQPPITEQKWRTLYIQLIIHLERLRNVSYVILEEEVILLQWLLLINL